MTLESLARTIAKARHGTDAMWANYMGAADAVVSSGPIATLIAAAQECADHLDGVTGARSRPDSDSFEAVENVEAAIRALPVT